jgi:uncharacterized protein YndB with AHSA1/START domain
MKKFLEDKYETQSAPLEVLNELFPKFSEQTKEIQEVSNKWVVVMTGKTMGDFSFQAAYQAIDTDKNLLYHVFIFDDKGEFVKHLHVEAVQLLPPLHKKTSGMDYFDFLEIQGHVFKWLAENGHKAFLIDQRPEGKTVYTLDETNAMQIVPVGAPEFIERARELHKKKQQTIITPDKSIITP